MVAWFVSRHPGAIAWAAHQGTHIARTVDHLDINAVCSGVKVVDTLPIHMAAEVCERGAHYFHLEISVPRELRGQELDASRLQAPVARLTELGVRKCVSAAPTPHPHDLNSGKGEIIL